MPASSLAWSLLWLFLSKKGIEYALGVFRGRAAHSLLHPLRQQGVSGGCLLCPFSGDTCACGSEPGTPRPWLSTQSLSGSTSRSAAALAHRSSGHAGCVVPGDAPQPAQGAHTHQSAGNEQNWGGRNEVMDDHLICCPFGLALWEQGLHQWNLGGLLQKPGEFTREKGKRGLR